MQRFTHGLGRALRETGQAIDRLGLMVGNKTSFQENFARNRPVMNLFDKRPLVGTDVFVAPNASVIGKVLLTPGSSVWYGAVIRGDKSPVRIDHNTNIQDRAVISTVTINEDSDVPADVHIGDHVTVGHGALLTSCTIGSNCLVGQGAIVEKGVVVQPNVIIGAGSVVREGTFIPSNQLWAGNPAAFVRNLTEADVKHITSSAVHYKSLADDHNAEFLPFGTIHQDVESRKK